MSVLISDTSFDLSGFVLGYLEQQGSLLTPPAFGVYEVLMSDQLAAELGVEPYLRLRFDSEATGDALRLTVNHPLVEAIAHRIQLEPGHAQLYINHVRLDKKGLLAVAENSYRFANARLFPKKGAMEQQALFHYLRFNFKATFVSDEKQEQLVSVLMNVQSGCPVQDSQRLELLRFAETTSAYTYLSAAAPRWPGAAEALALQTLQALLSRAQAAAQLHFADRVRLLQARSRRHLELDQARIDEYYAALEQDLVRRRDRLGAEAADRRAPAEEKIAVLRAERAAKLTDAEARYRLHIELELVNVQILVQPKLRLPVQIGHRRTTIDRYAVWDPLIHQLEPLICDVCGLPGEELHLCEGGHLAHEGCRAPQCVDCKREYCRLCAERVTSCAVCGQPVCQSSLIQCPVCKRGTCQAHRELCHAADGAPATLAPKTEPAAHSQRPAAAKAPSLPPAAAPQASSKKSTPRRAAKPAHAAPVSPKQPVAKAVRIHVEISAEVPQVVAYVMRSTNRVLARRVYELTPEGLLTTCFCEKQPCPATGWIRRPGPADTIRPVMEQWLAELCREYFVPAKRVDYHLIVEDQPILQNRLVLPLFWTDEERLGVARRGFDRRPR